jgi:hypothetical protein
MATSLEQEMAADGIEPTQDKLDRVRKFAAKARDLALEIKDLEESLALRKKELRDMRMETLPRLFVESGITGLDLSQEGNMPAYVVTLSDYFHAVIKADWDEEKTEKAMVLLEERHASDIIKNVIEIKLGRKENAMLKKVLAALSKLKVTVRVTRSVQWQTLTSWLREIYKQGSSLSDEELNTLGATVGQIVTIKPKEES